MIHLVRSIVGVRKAFLKGLYTSERVRSNEVHILRRGGQRYVFVFIRGVIRLG